ncbi:hypothetical protein, partial [Capnocytophaga sputigena]
EPKKEKTKDELLKEKLNIPIEAEIIEQTIPRIGFPSDVLAKHNNTFYFYKYDSQTYKVLSKHIEILPDSLTFRGEKVAQMDTKRLQPTFVYVNGYVSVVTIKVQFEDDGDFEYELYNKKVILNDENVKVVDIPYKVASIKYQEGLGYFVTIEGNRDKQLLYDANWDFWGEIPMQIYTYDCYHINKKYAVLKNEHEILLLEYQGNAFVKKYVGVLPELITGYYPSLKVEKDIVQIYFYKEDNISHQKNYYFKFTGKELILVNI